jgi:hypothetical protein
MIRFSYPATFTWLEMTFLALMLLTLPGCARIQVYPISGKEVTALEAKDVVRLMWEAGFTEKQILQAGVEVRNALAQKGGAQIKVNDKFETIIMVDPPNIDVTSRQVGSFLLNIKTGEIRR